MLETRKYRAETTPEECGQVLERLLKGDSAPIIAYEMHLTLACVCEIRNEAIADGEIVADKPLPTPEAVRQYCIKNGLFTCGGNEQYVRMLELVRIGFPIHDVATIIWICSSTEKHAEEIEDDLISMTGKGRSENNADHSDTASDT